MSHYLLDSLPHREYDIDRVENLSRTGWRRAAIDFIKIFIDFFGGMAILVFIAPASIPLPWLLLWGFFAALPDGISFLHYLWPDNKPLAAQQRFHKLIHIKQDKKETPWRLGIPFQIAVALAAIVLLNSHSLVH